MTSTAQREHSLQKQVVQALNFNRIMHAETDVMSGLMFLGKDTARRIAFINHHKALGWVKGCPDLVIILTNGETLWVELKDGNNNNPTFEQKAFMASLQRLGHNVAVWRTMDDCLNFIKGYKKVLAREVLDGRLKQDDYERAFGIERATASAKPADKRPADNKQQLEVAGEN